MQEYKPFTPSIGFDPYTNFDQSAIRINLREVDELFLSTDGFHDQFGGGNGRKLMAAKMKELLLQYSSLSPAEQEFHLRNFFMEWKGVENQTDDVLVIGIRNPSRR
jgi:serine phosphatase RsbU (regulator of sigma subunit)